MNGKLAVVLINLVIVQIYASTVEDYFKEYSSEFGSLKKLMRVGLKESKHEIRRAKERMEETINDGKMLRNEHLKSVVVKAETLGKNNEKCLQEFYGAIRKFDLHSLRHCQMTHAISASKHSKNNIRHLITKIDDKIVQKCLNKFPSEGQKGQTKKCITDELGSIKKRFREEEDKITASTREAMLNNEKCVSENIKILTDEMDDSLTSFERCAKKGSSH